MEKNYYYKILGVGPDAPLKEIEAGFHRALKSYHPDAGASNDEMVKEILQAYRILSDEGKRKEYDRNQLYEQKSNSDWIQRFDSIERREVIFRLKEGERVASDGERILGSVSHLQPDLKPKKGWGLYAVLSPFVISWVRMTLEIVYNIETLFYCLILSLGVVVPYIAVGVIKSRKNAKIERHNTKEMERVALEKKKVFAQVEEYLEIEGKALEVLPKRYQYTKAFCGIRELIEDGRADSMKEAINLYEQTKYQKDVINGMKTINTKMAEIVSELEDINENL